MVDTAPPSPSPLDQLRAARRNRIANESAKFAPDPRSTLTAGQNIQSKLDVVLSTLGGMAGGIVGGRVGGVRGGIKGAGIGSAVGQLGAEAARTQLDPTVTATAGEQIGEAAVNVGLAGVTGALGEAVLPVAGKITQPVRNGIARSLKYVLAPRTLDAEAMIAQDVLEEGGSTLSASQLTGLGGRLVNILEGIGESSFGSGAGAFHESQDAAIDTVARNVVKSLGPGTSLDDVAASKLLNVVFDEEFGKLITLAGGKYDQVDALAHATGTVVDSTPFFDYVSSHTNSKALKRVISSVMEGNPDKLLASKAPLVSEAARADTRATSFANARTAEIELRRYAKIQMASKNANLKAQGRIANRLARIVSKQVDDAASRLGPDARKVFNEANQIWGSNIERFQNKLIDKVIGTIQHEPGKLSRLLLAEGKADTIRAIKNAVGVERFNSTIKPRLLLSLAYRAAKPIAVTKAPTEALEHVTGMRLLEEMKKLGPDMLEEITGHSGASYDDLTRLGLALERTAMRPQGPGGIATVLRQPGALATAAGALAGGAVAGREGAVIGAAGVLIAPPIFQRIMSSKRLVKALARGIDMGPSGNALVRRTINRAATQITAQNAREVRRASDKAKRELLPSSSDAKATRKAATAAEFSSQFNVPEVRRDRKAGPSMPMVR